MVWCYVGLEVISAPLGGRLQEQVCDTRVFKEEKLFPLKQGITIKLLVSELSLWMWRGLKWGVFRAS